jgi:hypothetical protein
MIITAMTELNVYAASNFEYDFSQTQEAYLTEQGLSSTPNPPDPDKIFEYTPYVSLSAISVILFSMRFPQGAQIHAVALDQNNAPIAGSESQVPGILPKSKYTFETPVSAGTTLRFKIAATGLSGIKQYIFCDATITEQPQIEKKIEEVKEKEEVKKEQVEEKEEVKKEQVEEVKEEVVV